jgi:hypothetical protein
LISLAKHLALPFPQLGWVPEASSKEESGMAESRRAAREERVKALMLKYQSTTTAPLNPQAYWCERNYPDDPRHVDWRNPKRFLMTRLHEAALRGDLPEARRLVEESGANPFTKDSSHQFPSFTAWAEGFAEVADFLRGKMDAAIREW